MSDNFLNGFLAASILIAALLISGTWIYTANKRVSFESVKNTAVIQKEVSAPAEVGGCGI